MPKKRGLIDINKRSSGKEIDTWGSSVKISCKFFKGS